MHFGVGQDCCLLEDIEVQTLTKVQERLRRFDLALFRVGLQCARFGFSSAVETQDANHDSGDDAQNLHHLPRRRHRTGRMFDYTRDRPPTRTSRREVDRDG